MKTYKPKYSFEMAHLFKYVGIAKEGTHKNECMSYTNDLKGLKEEAIKRNLEIRKVI
jgi:hypothetical protein